MKRTWSLMTAAVCLLVIAARGSAAELSVDEIVTKLRSTDAADRKAGDTALAELQKRGPTGDEAAALIAASTRKEPDLGKDDQADEPVSAKLISVLAADPRPDYLKPIRAAFDQYPIETRDEAEAVFIGLGPGEGLKTFVGLLDEKAATGAACDAALLKLHGDDPVVFAALLQMLKYEGTTASGVAALLKFAEDDKLPAHGLEDHLPEISQSYQHWLDKLTAEIRTLHGDRDPEFRWNDDYRFIESTAEYFPDLLGHAGPGAEEILRKTLLVKAPRMSLFALQALLELKVDLPADAVEMGAGDDETREPLYETFEKKDLLVKFPAKYATQEALARSNMVRWLIYPTELNRAPNEIELMKVVSKDAGGGDGVVDIYLFRYRVSKGDWAEKGWMTGISGGYHKADEPTTSTTGLTFSSFDKWDAKTPEQHVDDLLKLLDDAAKEKDNEKEKT